MDRNNTLATFFEIKPDYEPIEHEEYDFSSRTSIVWYEQSHNGFWEVEYVTGEWKPIDFSSSINFTKVLDNLLLKFPSHVCKVHFQIGRYDYITLIELNKGDFFRGEGKTLENSLSDAIFNLINGRSL